MFETVLFPIDPSREALEPEVKALEFARRDGSRLVLLSVLQPVIEVKHDHEALAGVLSQTRKRCELAGVICQEVERSGKPASVICDVVNELNVLAQVNHSMLSGMHYAYQNSKHLYFVIDFCPGGELFYYL